MISPVRFSPARRLDVVGLNPQPLPPRYMHSFSQSANQKMWGRYDAVLLNPQPLPPRDSSRYEKVGLNPQPLPPKVYAEVAMNAQPAQVSLLTARTLGVIR